MFRAAVLVLCIAVTHAMPRKVCEIGPFGGSDGIPFNDELYAGNRITQVDLHHGFYIDGIQITYGTLLGPHHGGVNGDFSSFSLGDDEFIVKVQGMAGDRLDQLTFIDNKGQVYGPYGDPGGEEFVAAGTELAYISGEEGDYIDQITFVFYDC